MNNYVDLITPAYFKAMYTQVNKNVDDAFIQRAITKTQRMFLFDIIGKVWIEDMMSTIIASGTTGLTQADTIVLEDYLKPMHAVYTYCELLPTLSYQIDNSGVREKTVNESNTTSKSNISYLIENAKYEINYYLKEFNCYVSENSTLYPLHFQAKNGTPKHKQNGFSGIYFPNKIQNNYGYDY